MMCLGIDIGGTWIKYAPVFTRTGRCGARRSLPSPSDYAGLRAALDNILMDAGKEFGAFELIGISAAGELDENRGIILDACNLPGLNGFALKEYVGQVSGTETVVGNDAHCALIAEMRFGAAMQWESCILLTIGTGVGGAAATRHMLQHNAYFAELGHFPLMPKERLCTCGRCGCLEAYASCAALELEYVLCGGKTPHSAYEVLCSVSWDDRARTAVERYFSFLCAGIGSISEYIGIDNVLLGGGFSEADGFIEKLLEEAQRNGQGFPRVEKAVLGNDASLIGAALLKSVRS